MIGVLGGMGPYAGIDLVRKIFDQTIAHADQDHLPLLLYSAPHVPDRTAFLLGRVKTNPAYAIAAGLRVLESQGATVAGIPCNTSHAPPIFDLVLTQLAHAGSRLKVLHMIEEVSGFLTLHFRNIRVVGVLATTGTCSAGVYPARLERAGFRVLQPEERVQHEWVHPAIYDPTFGIKAQSNPVTERARDLVLESIAHLKDRGAEGIVLGCTELPLAVSARHVLGLPVIDATLVLARSLVREVAPAKLRPFDADNIFK